MTAGNDLQDGVFEGAFRLLEADQRIDAGVVARLRELHEQRQMSDAAMVLAVLREAAEDGQVQDRQVDGPRVPGQPT